MLVTSPAGARRRPQETTPAQLVDLARTALRAGRARCRLRRRHGDVLHGDQPHAPRARAPGTGFATRSRRRSTRSPTSMSWRTWMRRRETVRSARALADGKPVVVSPVTLAATGQLPRCRGTTADAAGASCRTRSTPASRPSSAQRGRRAASSTCRRRAPGSVTYYETTGWRGVIERADGPAAGAVRLASGGRLSALPPARGRDRVARLRGARLRVERRAGGRRPRSASR